jgi:hypothetical protein
MAHGIICQACGVEAPARYVEFYQNVGALVVRFHKRMKGNLCKRCIHKTFWKYTLTTTAIGWCGTVSLFVAPIFVVNNVARYVAALGLPPVPPGAKVPVVDAAAAVKLQPHRAELVRRINAGEQLVPVAQAIAKKARVTPGQVVRYLSDMASANRGQSPSYGFPVQPAPTAATAPIPVEPLPPLEQ